MPLVHLVRQRRSIHRRQLGGAGELRRPVEVEIEGWHVRDRMIEGREARRVGVEVAFVLRAHDHNRRLDAELLEHGDDERLALSLQSPEAAREILRAAVRLEPVDAELEGDVAASSVTT